VDLVCDFHAHSRASDGTLTPEELAEAASAAGVDVLALTDHDETRGVAAARARGEALGVEVWGGIELSVSERDGARQMHVLGLGIDVGDPALCARTAALRAAREERFAEIVRRLGGLGVRISLEDVRDGTAPGSLGRRHAAAALVRAGACASLDEAFARWLRRGRPAYVPSPGVDAREAIDLVHGAGGVASLAHPIRSVGVDRPGGFDAFVSELVPLGLDGLEVWHPSHGPGERKRIRRLVRRHGLLATGGSDFHGDAPDVRLGSGRGNVRVGREAYDALVARRERLRSAGA
jgi:predicted metal-dependent phosphoesterase TrpH